MSPARRMIRCAVEPQEQLGQRARRDGATTIWVTLLARAYSTTPSASSAPGTVTASPPEPLGQAQRLGDAVALGLARASRCLSTWIAVQGRAAGRPGGGHSAPAPRLPGAPSIRNQHALARRPRAADGMGCACSRPSARRPAGRCGAAPVRAAPSGCRAEVMLRPRAPPAAADRPCRPSAAGAGLPASGRPARYRRRGR